MALGADGGCLVLSWNHSKSSSCLLVRHKYRHTNQGPASALRFDYYHAAASLPFKFVPAPLSVTHDTNATRPTASTTAPPCPPPTRCAGGPTGAVACEAEYFFRVVVVVVSSVVRLGGSGTTPNAQTSRISRTRFRALVKYDLKRSPSPLLRTCLVAFVRVDGAERRPETCDHFRWLGSSRTTLGWATNHSARYKGSETVVSVFSASVLPWAFSKEYGAFFVWFLVGQRLEFQWLFPCENERNSTYCEIRPF